MWINMKQNPEIKQLDFFNVFMFTNNNYHNKNNNNKLQKNGIGVEMRL